MGVCSKVALVVETRVGHRRAGVEGRGGSRGPELLSIYGHWTAIPVQSGNRWGRTPHQKRGVAREWQFSIGLHELIKKTI